MAQYQKLVLQQGERGAVIMVSALLENALQTCIRARLADPGNNIVETWFTGPTAPFATFSAKIKLGRALAIYGPKMEKKLTTMKNVRNAFAHSSTPINCSEPAVVAECEKLMPPSRHGYKQTSTLVIYVSACLVAAHALTENSFKHGGKEIEIDIP